MMNNKDIARIAIDALRAGKMTYDEARIKCQPYLVELNQTGDKIAKKYGRKFYPINFAVFRNKFQI